MSVSSVSVHFWDLFDTWTRNGHWARQKSEMKNEQLVLTSIKVTERSDVWSEFRVDLLHFCNCLYCLWSHFFSSHFPAGAYGVSNCDWKCSGLSCWRRRSVKSIQNLNDSKCIQKSLEMANIPGLPVRPARGKSMGLQDNGHIKINMDL